MKIFVSAFVLTFLAGSLLRAESAPVEQTTPKDQPLTELRGGSFIRVNSTNQAYDFFRPWSKKVPFNRRGLGAIIAKGQVLTTAELVANSNFIELEKPESGERGAGHIVVIDHETNLALIEPDNASFLADLKPLDTGGDAKVGDRLSVVQLESSGLPISTQATITSVEVGRYVIEGYSFLLWRMSCPLQYRDNSFTLPVVRGGQLLGLLLRYDPRSQTLDAISTPVIKHFLGETVHQPYSGFPRLGVEYSSTRDPQFRSFEKLPANEGGVYVSEIEPLSSAALGGLRVGDIILSVSGKSIDADGNYLDSSYGKISLIHLTTCAAYVGQKIPIVVFRGGNRVELQIEMQRRAPDNYVIDPYVIGRAPRFYILGGLVFQELSRQFLQEWGNNWLREAPQKFVYFDRYQAVLFPTPRKLVFLSQIMPTNDTVGYEQLNNQFLTVVKLNGREVLNLDDFAAALQHPVNGFHQIEFDSDPKIIYLSAQQVEQNAPALQKLYSLPILNRL